MPAFDEILSAVVSTTISEAAVLVREIRVQVGVLRTPVSIRVYCDPKEEPCYFFELSRYMNPEPAEPARKITQRRAQTEVEALRLAARMLTEDYEAAIRTGKLPEDSWLVPGDVR